MAIFHSYVCLPEGTWILNELQDTLHLHLDYELVFGILKVFFHHLDLVRISTSRGSWSISQKQYIVGKDGGIYPSMPHKWSTYDFHILHWQVVYQNSPIIIGIQPFPQGWASLRKADGCAAVVKICPENQASHYWGVTMDCIFHTFFRVESLLGSAVCSYKWVYGSP